MTKKIKNKHYGILSRYNNKRIIEIASFAGGNEKAIKTMEKGLVGTIRNCNDIQKDVYLEYYNLDDNDIHSFGIMVDENCPYEDETVKKFFISQLVTTTGIFFLSQEMKKTNAS